MEVILIKDVPSLGNTGQVINVADGYARNYLIPRRLAMPATESAKRIALEMEKLIKKRLERIEKDAESLKEVIHGRSITIPVEVGAQDRIFGSVTAQDISDALKAEGIDINKRLVLLDEPIKGLGEYSVKINLGKSIDAEIKVWVVKKE